MKSRYLTPDDDTSLFHGATSKVIRGSHLSDQRDRTLLLYLSKYGWIQHVYLHTGEITVVGYDLPFSLRFARVELAHDTARKMFKITSNDDYLKALEYLNPESTDLEFALLLAARGHHLEFRDWNAARAKRVRGRFHGFILSELK